MNKLLKLRWEKAANCRKVNVCFEAMNCECLPILTEKKDCKRSTAGETDVNNVRLFTYHSLRSVTRDFHPSCKIGGGGFGVVYKEAIAQEFAVLEANQTWDLVKLPRGKKLVKCKWVFRIKQHSNGTIERNKARLVAKGFTQREDFRKQGVLRDGTEVAIKSLSAESKQGSAEFLTEIRLISRIEHPNLVKLIGCCVEGSHRVLVYEFLQNNSIYNALLGSGSKHVALDWYTRAAICKGIACGLAFLHDEADPPVVHRDIKASNVLLDAIFNPKIGDFGLAKLFPDNVTHLSTRVAGTMGYLAPEYALLGQLTKKADVYSFGVLMLEIISGRVSGKAAFGEDLLLLVEWTWNLKKQNRLLDIVDPELTVYPEGEVTRFIKVALFCTRAAANLRPIMKQIVEMLSKEVHLRAGIN